MRFEDIPAPLLSSRVAPLAGDELAEGPVLAVYPVEEHPGEFELRTRTGLVRVTPTHDADVHVLNAELGAGRTVLAHLFSPAPDGTADLHLRLFNREQHEMGRLEIGVDERALTAGKRIVGNRRLSDAQLCDELWRRSTYTVGDQSFFFVTAGEAAKEELEDAATRRAFALQGDGVRFAVEEFTRPDSATIFLASKVTPRRSADPAVRLARGTLTFLDWTTAGALGVLASTGLSELVAGEGSYLKKWDDYGQVEGDIFLERARAVGKLRILSADSTRNGRVEVTAEVLSVEQARALAGIAQLELTDELPSYLTNPQLSWSEYCDEFSGGSRTGDQRAGGDSPVVKVLSVRGQHGRAAARRQTCPAVVDLPGRQRGSPDQATDHGSQEDPRRSVRQPEPRPAHRGRGTADPTPKAGPDRAAIRIRPRQGVPQRPNAQTASGHRSCPEHPRHRPHPRATGYREDDGDHGDRGATERARGQAKPGHQGSGPGVRLPAGRR